MKFVIMFALMSVFACEVIQDIAFCDKTNTSRMQKVQQVSVPSNFKIKSHLCSKDMPVLYATSDNNKTKQVLAFLTQAGCLIEKSILVDCIKIGSILLKNKSIMIDRYKNFAKITHLDKHIEKAKTIVSSWYEQANRSSTFVMIKDICFVFLLLASFFVFFCYFISKQKTISNECVAEQDVPTSTIILLDECNPQRSELYVDPSTTFAAALETLGIQEEIVAQTDQRSRTISEQVSKKHKCSQCEFESAHEPALKRHITMKHRIDKEA